MNAPLRARDFERPLLGSFGVMDPRAGLRAALAPFAPWLARDDVDAILVDRPGEAWIEFADRDAFGRVELPQVDDALLERLAGCMVRSGPQRTHRLLPLGTATLADGARLQVTGPPITRAHWALAIRKPRIDDLGLLAYARRSARRDACAFELDVDDPIDALQRAVEQRATIVVSGGASSGKTTFLGALLRTVPDHERVVAIEDTHEVRLPRERMIGLAARPADGVACISTCDLVPVAQRLRADRLVLGELTAVDTLPFLRAVSTAHAGSLATIRADSPHEALAHIAFMLMQAGLGFTHADTLRFAASAIDLIVQLDRRGGYRRVAQIATTRDLLA